MSSKIILFCFLCFASAIVCGVFFPRAVVYAHGLNETYRNKDVVVQDWKDLCDGHPDVASYEVIGKSVLGKEIYLFKIGNPNGSRVMMNGQTHGDEDGGSETMLVFARWLLESGSPQAQNITRQNMNLFIPVLNVDSYVRQNMRRQYILENGTVIKARYGVDLNRNAVWGWGRGGSGDPYDNYDYPGLYAGSEPETQAWRYACEKYRPRAYLDIHNGAYGNIAYHSNSMFETTVLELMASFSLTNKVPNYPAHRGIGGGFIATDADETFGASGWLIEVAAWSEMPPTLDEFLEVYYPKMLPVYLAVNYAVMMENPPTPEPTIPEFQTGILAILLLTTTSLFVLKKKARATCARVA